MERELYTRDGELAAINHALNKIGFIQDVVVVMMNNEAVACGAFREFDTDSAELKRMYVQPSHRSKGLASKILIELESIAKDKGYEYAVLETGKNQPEAVAFYLKHGYEQVPAFGKYIDSVNSICFRKQMA
ncbi:MAG: GNAT family N-acetyltransferase [Chitinophagaceae bacterium]|nr:GNAT family N-acetyltransferase [Chitinophagaceae bacterium]